MRDAVYVIVALALCMIACVFVMHTTTKQPTNISMFELKEFAHLPLEIRHVLRKTMVPDQMLSKQKWASLNPAQKQTVIDHITSMFQQQQQFPDLPILDPAPSVMPKDPPPAVNEDGFKRGFLLTESKKSHTKNKKKDKAETLVQVVASPEEPASGGDAAAATGGFLGNDD